MGYTRPAGDVHISSPWQDHKNRNPPSQEPGTDYGSGYGSNVYAPEAGVVVDIQTRPQGASGRFVCIDLDDGRRTRTLHLSAIKVRTGQRVKRGQVVALSGASGFGDNWYYGPHAHQTLWSTQQYRFCSTCTIDFAKYVGSPTPPPQPPQEDDVPKLTKVGIDKKTPQRVTSDQEYIRLNDDGAVSVFTSPHDVVMGEFALIFEVVTASSNPKASIAVYPVIANLNSSGNTVSVTTVGLQENVVTTSKTAVSISLAPLELKKDQRVRFQVRTTDGLVVDITAGTFRGVYWDN